MITTQDFLNYFKRPSELWLLKLEELEDFFSEEKWFDLYSDLSLDNKKYLLRLITESDKCLFSENQRLLNELKDQKLTETFRKLFGIPQSNFHDYSSIPADVSQTILDQLNDSTEDLFFYRPSLEFQDLRINPTAIYRYRGKIYLIEHFWSMHLKKESLGIYIFYHHFFKAFARLEIDQYLVSYLSNFPSAEAELMAEIGNSLPFTAQKKLPSDPSDETFKNINVYFGLEMEYEGSLYESLFTREDYLSINSAPWELEDEKLSDPRSVVRELLTHEQKSLENANVERLMVEFLDHKSRWIQPSTDHYKSFFRHFYPGMDYSSKLISLVKFLSIFCSLKEPANRDRFLKHVTNMEFFSPLFGDQDYLIFEAAIEKFQEIRRAKIKVYYDFETISLPFPYLDNTKPYMQMVLQMSLITVVNGRETKVTNLIVDPHDLCLDRFKEVIDAIYEKNEEAIYLVYSKSFENSRLKEMAQLIGNSEYSAKARQIIERTVDLADWFFYGNNPHIIHRKLKGFHSIKKVNGLVPEELAKEAGAKAYSDLERCQNGIMAQSLLLNRLLTKDTAQDEANWNRNKKFMLAYCENDVRSMIAVEKYIDHLLTQSVQGPSDLRQFLKLKKFYKSKKINYQS